MQVLSYIQNRHYVIVVQLGFLTSSKQLSRLEDVLDLPTVHIHERKLIQLTVGNGVLLLSRGEEVFPNQPTGLD